MPQVDGSGSCSPDLNSIEQALSRIKLRMSKAQRRTVDDTWRHIGGLVETDQTDACANYLKNDQYDSVKR
ncbi:insertion sequence transposase protein [Rhizobium sp. PDO1-076]|nr:insertion sequence transposase protein [Rhizobium sp. PDO1-076]